MRRAVTRLVTPGTITEDRLLDSSRNNYLAALVRVAGSDGADRHALAWIDISTGEFRIAECRAGRPGGRALRIEPREVLVLDRLASDAEMRSLVGVLGAALTPLPAAFFDAAHAEDRLAALFGVKTIEAFGNFSRAELSAGAALIAYVEKTQIAKRPPIEPPKRLSDGETMRIDAATRANLELFRSTSGSRAGTLIAAIDRTQSAAGSRLLAERLASPLTDPVAIDRRLDGVAFFLERPDTPRRRARGACPHARHAARAFAARARSRRSARSRHDPRWDRSRRQRRGGCSGNFDRAWRRRIRSSIFATSRLILPRSSAPRCPPTCRF